MSLLRQDPSITNYVTVGTEPAGFAALSDTTLSMPNDALGVYTTIINSPVLVDNPRASLSKWEAFFSVFFWADGDPDFLWPGGANAYAEPLGSLLTSAEKKVPIYTQWDWAPSIDGRNCRIHNIIIRNTTGDVLDVYVHRKFYTTTASTGT